MTHKNSTSCRCACIALAGCVLAPAAWSQATQSIDRALTAIVAAPQDATANRLVAQAAPPGAAAATRLKVFFKLDPRLSGPTYGGERWVSPPTFMGASAQDSVQTRVEGVGAQGQPIKLSAKWTPSDPAMVEVLPGVGHDVNIKVKRPGESTLEFAAQGVTRQLAIKAEQKNNVLLVQLSQQP